jgi:hypothetical protein
MSMKNSDTIGNRSRHLPVCSAVPKPLRYRVPQWLWYKCRFVAETCSRRVQLYQRWDVLGARITCNAEASNCPYRRLTIPKTVYIYLQKSRKICKNCDQVRDAKALIKIDKFVFQIYILYIFIYILAIVLVTTVSHTHSCNFENISIPTTYYILF